MTLEMIFNEAEALTETFYVVEPTEEQVFLKKKTTRSGKREADLKDLSEEVIQHTLWDKKID